MQNKKPIWKSEINLEIRNQFGNQKSKFRNQVRNHGDLKSRHNFEGVGPLAACLKRDSDTPDQVYMKFTDCMIPACWLAEKWYGQNRSSRS